MAVVVMPLQTIVGVLYWGFVLYDPWTLFPRDTFPRDQKVAEAVIRATHTPAALVSSWFEVQPVVPAASCRS